MRRYDINDKIVIVKEGDRNYSKEGAIINISELIHCPVTIYQIAFEDGSKRDYFWADIRHA